MSGVLLGFAIVLVLVGVGFVAAWVLPGEARAMQRGIAPLVYMPVLAWVVGRFLFGLDGLDLLGVVLMAALPTAQNVFLFAGHFRLATTPVRDVTLLLG
ncbi:hypothetical protein [Promicromonospora sp. NPDC019610]|uniref:hypothetical protein n=1 Tax=Promicromonospora sp. NPDC019610 TaxID=3364405 RepID=UPI0037B6468D